jgi:hypothetical protein
MVCAACWSWQVIFLSSKTIKGHHLSLHRMGLLLDLTMDNAAGLRLSIDPSEAYDQISDYVFLWITLYVFFYFRWQRSYNKKTARWSVQPVKADKSYSYVPRLLRVIICIVTQIRTDLHLLLMSFPSSDGTSTRHGVTQSMEVHMPLVTI